jgi:hypothetical protein
MDSHIKGYIKSNVSETNSISVIRAMRSDCTELPLPMFPYLGLAQRWRQTSNGSWWPESRDCCVCPLLCLAVTHRWQSLGCQVLLSMNPLSVLKLFGCDCISVASLTRLSTYPFTLSSLWILLNFLLCPVCICSTTADLSGWPRQKCLMCSLHLISVLLRVCVVFSHYDFAYLVHCGVGPSLAEEQGVMHKKPDSLSSYLDNLAILIYFDCPFNNF